MSKFLLKAVLVMMLLVGLLSGSTGLMAFAFIGLIFIFVFKNMGDSGNHGCYPYS